MCFDLSTTLPPVENPQRLARLKGMSTTEK